MRILQAILLPGLAIALAAGPIAGQSYGARDASRVRATFLTACMIATVTMLMFSILLLTQSVLLVAAFGTDDIAVAVGATFLRMMCSILVAQSLTYVCATLFQGLGNTVPALVSSAMRFAVFTVAVLWFASQPAFHIDVLWYAWIASVLVQAAMNISLLHGQFVQRAIPRLWPRLTSGP